MKGPKGPVKLTGDRETPESALEALKKEARALGLGEEVVYYVVEETISFKPVNKTTFSFMAKTETV